jgi:hypothetical protein
MTEMADGRFHVDLYWANGGGWLADVVSDASRERVAGPFRMEQPWRSDQLDAAKSEACEELPAQGWDVTSGWRWYDPAHRFEARVRPRPCIPLCSDVPVRELRPGDVVVLGTLGGMIELIRCTGTVCGYVRWRHVHRDAKALGRRGTVNMLPDSTALVLTRGLEP